MFNKDIYIEWHSTFRIEYFLFFLEFLENLSPYLYRLLMPKARLFKFLSCDEFLELRYNNLFSDIYNTPVIFETIKLLEIGWQE